MTSLRWCAVVGDLAARDLARAGWRALRVIEVPVSLVSGDRVMVVRVRRTVPVANALVLGTADIRGIDDGPVLRLRHRVVAPTGHEPLIAAVPQLVARLGWTDARIRGLIGTIEILPAADFDRVEAVLHERALAFGPPPKRDAHRRPRTPGRRPLATSRIRSRSRP